MPCWESTPAGRPPGAARCGTVYEGVGGPGNPLTADSEIIRASYHAALAGFPDATRVAACISGACSAAKRTQITELLRGRFPGAKIRVEPNYVAAFSWPPRRPLDPRRPRRRPAWQGGARAVRRGSRWRPGDLLLRRQARRPRARPRRSGQHPGRDRPADRAGQRPAGPVSPEESAGVIGIQRLVQDQLPLLSPRTGRLSRSPPSAVSRMPSSLTPAAGERSGSPAAATRRCTSVTSSPVTSESGTRRCPGTGTDCGD